MHVVVTHTFDFLYISLNMDRFLGHGVTFLREEADGVYGLLGLCNCNEGPLIMTTFSLFRPSLVGYDMIREYLLRGTFFLLGRLCIHTATLFTGVPF